MPADLALGKMRSKIADLPLALEGRFGENHAMLCRLRLDQIDHREAMMARLDAQVEAVMRLCAPGHLRGLREGAHRQFANYHSGCSMRYTMLRASG